MEYVEGARAIRNTFMDVLLCSGADEATEASRRLAEWMGMDAGMVDHLIDELEQFRLRDAA